MSGPPRHLAVHLAALGALVGVTGAPATGQDARADASSARAERAFRAVRTLLREGRRDRFATEAVVEQCGGRAERAFEWVRDRTAWVDYDGALRGPRGVLMDRVGNSLDRALLLAELCRQCGEEVRLAQALLEPELLETLAGRVRPLTELGERFAPAVNDERLDGQSPGAQSAGAQSPGAQSPGAQSPGAQSPGAQSPGAQSPEIESLESWAARVRLPQRAVTTAAAADRLVAERSAAAARERATRATSALTELLELHVPQPGTEPARVLPSTPLEHTWVQVLRDDTWVALDPLLLDSRWGDALAPARSTFAAEDLAAEAYHRIELRVVAEQWTDAGRTEHVLVERHWRTADTVGETVQVYNVPLYAAPDLAELRESSGWEAQLCARVRTEREWLPVIALGDDDHWERGVRANGAPDDDPQTRETGKAIRRAIDALESVDSPDSDPTGFTAEWLEIELIAPGAPARIVRRQIFDLVGFDARSQAGPDAAVPGAIDDAAVLSRNLALLGSTTLLPLASDVPAEFVTRLALYRLWSQRDLFLQSADAGGAGDGDLEGALEALPTVEAFHAALWSWALARRAWSPDAAATYLDSANLVAWHDRMLPTESGGVRFQSGFDVVEQRVASQGEARAAFLARLSQGVVDTVAEAALLERLERLGAAERASLDLAANRTTLSLLSSPSDVDRELAAWPAELRARILAELESGAVVAVPELSDSTLEPWQHGFWRIDPNDGSCLGVGGQGFGAAMRQDVPNYTAIQVAQIKFMFAALKAYKCVGDSRNEAEGKACIKALWCSAASLIAGLADPRLNAVVGGVCSM